MIGKELKRTFAVRLNDVDTELQKYGCRVNNSDICAICLDSSTVGKKQYFKLKVGGLDE